MKVQDNGNSLNVSVIIPSLNPDEKLKQVVGGLIEKGFNDIVIVNDGSDTEHMEPFETLKSYPQCTILTHEVNMGKGKALKDAFLFVWENRKEIAGVITVDGDNQHGINDIINCKASKVAPFLPISTPESSVEILIYILFSLSSLAVTSASTPIYFNILDTID